LVVVLAFSGQTFALSGKMTISLNRRDVSGHCRANQIITLFASIPINVDVPSYSWMELWLPIDEAMPGTSDFCDGLPMISGTNESPRFLPNNKYFEKYPDSPEKNFGKLYKMNSKAEGGIEFIEPDQKAIDDKRLIPDPSGLGYWITGTLLPKLERDSKAREKTLKRIGYDLDFCGG